MIDSLYQLLSQLGFSHPLHPALTHLPMGMVMGAFLFSLASLKYPELAKTPDHCTVLALIFVPPTVVAGIMDWQYFYGGDWSAHFVIKFVLAVLLTVLLIAAIKTGRSQPSGSKLPIVLHALCLLAAIGLGFTGGEIQYG